MDQGKGNKKMTAFFFLLLLGASMAAGSFAVITPDRMVLHRRWFLAALMPGWLIIIAVTVVLANA